MSATMANACWRRRARASVAYGSSVMGVAVALLLTETMTPLHHTPTVLFTAVIVGTAWLVGKGPTFVAILLSALAIDYFYIPPRFSLMSSLADVVCALVFVFVAVVICYLNEFQQLTDAKLRLALSTVETALKEKEVLLRELNHRVKNNLQIIASLLSLQCGRAQDTACQDLFQECRRRVRAIALVQERLCRTSNVADFDLDAYVRDLVHNLLHSYRTGAGSITTRIEVENARLKMDQLVPCALIINELVCNSLKHAFPHGRSGEVLVDLRCEGKRVRLTVTDDGVGLRAIQAPTSEGAGLQVVRALVDQLCGTIEWFNGKGTSATITFPGNI
jgi:two-component sensor histidine kinase